MRDFPAEGAGQAKHPWWLWPNLLSLDAPLVAVAWQWLFAEVLRARLPWMMYLFLGGAVWLIYVFDRLLDVRRMGKKEAPTARHAFYGRHRGFFLVAAAAAAAGLAAAAPFFVPGALAARAVFLFVLVALYFELVWLSGGKVTIPGTKEVFCGVIFALGVTLAPNFYSSLATNPFMVSVKGFFLEWGLALFDVTPLPTLLFGMLCVANCVAISIWEDDRKTGAGGEEPAETSPPLPGWLWVPVAAGLIAAASYRDHLAPVYLCVSASAAGLWLLAWKGRAMSRSALRALADAVLMTPVVVMGVRGVLF